MQNLQSIVAVYDLQTFYEALIYLPSMAAQYSHSKCLFMTLFIFFQRSVNAFWFYSEYASLWYC